MFRALSLTALALAVLTPSAASAQVCYSMPFPDSVITDPWACGSACGRGSPHRGTDFGRACGTPIPAIAAGVVIANERSTCLGNVIAIRHGDGLVSGYAHMSAPSPIPIGATVTRGQIIGSVGETGSPTCVMGCHLHLTLGAADDSWWAGDYTRTIDPVAHIHGHEAGVNCEEGTAALDRQAATYAAPSSTDVNGDGRADLCARASDGFHCYPATADGWGESWAPIPWTDAGTWNELNHYSTIRMGDVNGDRLADACIRSNDAFHCALSNGEGFDEMTVWREGISDAGTWGERRYFQTIRLADVDADGRDDFCARHAAGFSCWLSDGTTFATRIDGPLWSDASGFDAPQYYGTLRMGDIDGDGRADVCVRASANVVCALSTGDGFGEPIAGPEWSTASGYGAARFFSTMRMGDVNGDGLADLCIRNSLEYRCHFSTGDGFATASTTVGAMPDASGWDDPTNYETIRLGDVNGDGAQDICARANAELLCWWWNGSAFERFSGPAWSDESGWSASGYYYDTIRIADQNGDGRADACARASTGFRCHLSTGEAFEVAPLDSGLLANAQGWDGSASFWSTIYMSGSCVARPETCNGRDDDCDGEVDDGTCIDAPATPDGGADRDTGAGGIDAGRARGTVGGSCACHVGTGAPMPGSLLMITTALALAGARRRRVTTGPGCPG